MLEWTYHIRMEKPPSDSIPWEVLKETLFIKTIGKKKSHKDSEAKNIQINFHCKVKELLQWRITGLNVSIMT